MNIICKYKYDHRMLKIIQIFHIDLYYIYILFIPINIIYLLIYIILLSILCLDNYFILILYQFYFDEAIDL